MDYVPLPKSRLWKGKADFFRPFRTAAANAGENITPLYDPALHRVEQPEELDLKELNTALAALVNVFPDVDPEVFREMLLSISEESRLEVVTEHLLTKQAKWVRGRYISPQSPSNEKLEKHKLDRGASDFEVTVPEEVMLRSDNYKKAVKQAHIAAIIFEIMAILASFSMAEAFSIFNSRGTSERDLAKLRER
ncbi:hypothetical protein LTR37_004489 [Vermiconidia calcicola]|uniref:Uncharacterized protein n=1 Tax=Vermiconidia calcicola TaxID=1690605 RepID=A0ACC3NM59_9PEZI|nr:hypothetical protein LTR37_004489 [Vermiconidia calcicola]